MDHTKVTLRSSERAISQIGLIGLAVMGANLARNIAGQWYATSVYNRTPSVTEEFVAKFGQDGSHIRGYGDIEAFVQSIETPRKIIVMVQAGKAVDVVLDQLVPLLDPQDIVIDCGNSFYRDTERRMLALAEREIRFVGCGVSGGEEGALRGPSIMPGGSSSAYAEISGILESVSASDFHSGKCVTYVWEGASGHFVKMVHNGIEYAVMQMIAESYDLLRRAYGLDAAKIADIFGRLNSGKLRSYLFEITANVLRKRDDLGTGAFLVDVIKDSAGAKGTGKWTSVEGLDRAKSVSTIAEATFSRAISSETLLRKRLSESFRSAQNIPAESPELPLDAFVAKLENALYTGMLFAYAQGYALIAKASQEEQWGVNLSEVSRIWQGGCIIRADILDFLERAFRKNPHFTHLLELGDIASEIESARDDYREILRLANDRGVPCPALSSGWQYFLSITQERSSANLIQGLRDYFGAHTYERTDRDGVFHTQWTADKP